MGASKIKNINLKAFQLAKKLKLIFFSDANNFIIDEFISEKSRTLSDERQIKKSKTLDKDISDVYTKNITVVLVKTGGITSIVIDECGDRLKKLGVDFYVSDIDKLTPMIVKQAAIENTNNSILAIKVEKSSIEDDIAHVFTNYVDDAACMNGSRNSDSLAISIESSIKGDRQLLCGVRGDLNNRTPTKLESDLKSVQTQVLNTIKNVTISMGNDNVDLISDAIVDGVFKYSCMTEKQRNQSYFRIKPVDIKKIIEGKDKDEYHNLLLMNPLPDCIKYEFKYPKSMEHIR